MTVRNDIMRLCNYVTYYVTQDFNVGNTPRGNPKYSRGARDIQAVLILSRLLTPELRRRDVAFTRHTDCHSLIIVGARLICDFVD